jgi:pyruvate ferredoxin oxidoreductase gamma subunit
MLEIRLHGRGGQGAVTSAELLALAVINEGKYGQAFPSFGPERRGAPVVAFFRVDDQHIKVRASITNPDLVLVLDPSILRIVNVTEGLKDDGILIANTKYRVDEIRSELNVDCKLAVVNANRIAFEELGIPITNTTMLGALLKAKAIVNPDAMLGPIRDRFGRLAEKNINAFKRALKETQLSF